MNGTSNNQKTNARLNWSRVTGMMFAGAFHIAAFMVLLAPSEPIAPPPPKPKPLVQVDIVKEQPRKLEVLPMPIAPEIEVNRQPQPTPVDVAPERIEAPVDVLVQAEPMSPMDTVAEPVATTPEADFGPVGPSQIQGYDHGVMPEYPSRARKLRQEGLVMLRVLVSATGDPMNVEIETSSGHRLLDQAAHKAVKTWKFNPGRSNGQPVQGWVLVPINFSLTK